jgi:MoaA/NifB/PqqE/SkfB family radical SAM enzyme
MPGVARHLDVPALAVNPYYYFPPGEGEAYEAMMREHLACECYSWSGFERERSGIDFDEFVRIHRDFRSRLGEIELIPFMDFTEEDYRGWFSGSTGPAGAGVPVGPRRDCQNPWRLLDIQPDGDANFCVDYPDYVIGNVAEQSIEEVWNGPRAEKFRAFIKEHTPPVCNRCGAKYMS